jgi:type IV pilus assembly protein PilB
MLQFNEALRQSVRSGNHNDQVRMLARHNGIKFMQEYALDLVREGVTTFEEVQRVVAFGEISALTCASCTRELSPNFAFCPYCGVKRHGWRAPIPIKKPAANREAVNE